MILATDSGVIVAAIGAILYTLMKYIDKKRADPGVVFDATYLIALVGAVYGAVQAVQKLGLQFDVLGLITAFFIGFSFSAGVSSINSRIPIELPVGAATGGVTSQDLVDLKKRIAEQDGIIRKLQEKPPMP
jgi:hypothetical protein